MAIIALLLLNISTVTSFKMFDIVSSLVRMASVPVAALFDDGTHRKRPTWGEAVEKSDNLEAKNRLKNAEIDGLSARNQKLAKELKVAGRKNEALELDLSQTKARHADEVAHLTTENKVLRKKIVSQVPPPSSRKVRNEVKERVTGLMERLSRSTALEVSSAPAELSSVGPGTFVALGLLIYEVRDTCLQMGELKELYDLVSLPEDEDKLGAGELETICGLNGQDLKDFIFSKTPQEACRELRIEMQQIEVPGCEDFPVEGSGFGTLILDDPEVTQNGETGREFSLPELD
ncbi:hypothetical protein [Shimia thalassica]|uniref:hypothetical protein n=1 Tax=Shimia thalassica TaxID=1715693 RepID=UPI0026E48BC3|nr:hypothetical protein [Shimia thalassica]MDO6479841.1 hypothetical protein [Shimia thalassica]